MRWGTKPHRWASSIRFASAPRAATYSPRLLQACQGQAAQGQVLGVDHPRARQQRHRLGQITIDDGELIPLTMQRPQAHEVGQAAVQPP